MKVKSEVFMADNKRYVMVELDAKDEPIIGDELYMVKALRKPSETILDVYTRIINGIDARGRAYSECALFILSAMDTKLRDEIRSKINMRSNMAINLAIELGYTSLEEVVEMLLIKTIRAEEAVILTLLNSTVTKLDCLRCSSITVDIPISVVTEAVNQVQAFKLYM